MTRHDKTPPPSSSGEVKGVDDPVIQKLRSNCDCLRIPPASSPHTKPVHKPTHAPKHHNSKHTPAAPLTALRASPGVAKIPLPIIPPRRMEMASKRVRDRFSVVHFSSSVPIIEDTSLVCPPSLSLSLIRMTLHIKRHISDGYIDVCQS